MQPSIFLQKPFWKEWTEGRQVLFWLKLTLFFLLFLFWTSNEAAAQCGPYITLSPNNPNQSAANNSDVFLTIWFTDPSPANNTTVGTWSGWSQAGNGNSTSARFNPAVEGSGVYFVKYTISQPAGMCQLNEMAFDTIYVDGNNSSQIPGVTANYTSVCPGGTVQLTATPTDSTFSVPVFNYSISSSTSVGASVNASGLVTAGSTGQIVVAVTETSAYGVSQAANFIINVVNPPIATANVPVVTNCAGSVSSGILLSTSHIPSAQVEYVVTGVVSSFNINTLAPGTVIGSGNNAPFPTPTLINSNFNGNVTYQVSPRLNNGSGCVGAPIDITINIEATPNFISTPANDTTCSGSNVSFFLSTNYTQPGNVVFWLTGYIGHPDIISNHPAPGPVGVGPSYLNGQSFQVQLTNMGTAPQTVQYFFTSVRTDGLQCIGTTVAVNVTINPDLEIIPVFQFINSGQSFSLQLNPLNIPVSGAGDLEFLLMMIPSNPNLVRGNTVTPGVTVVPSGGTFSEMLTNISNSFQAIDYYFRPQLRSSRVNPNDPLSATCFGQTVPAVSIGVYPIPNAFVSGGDISANEALVCNGMANTMMTLNTNTNASPFSLGHFISGVTATNVGNPNLYALNDLIGFGSGIPIFAPTLVNNSQFGEVIYQITPFMDMDFSQDFTPGDILGTPTTARIVVEPDLIVTGPAPIMLCEDFVTGNVGFDVDYNITSAVLPSPFGFIRAVLDSVVIEDPNPNGGAWVTTILEGVVNPALMPPYIIDGAPGAAYTGQIQDAITIVMPQNFLMPVTIRYKFVTSVQTNTTSSKACDGLPFEVLVIVNPSPDVEINPSGPLTVCEGSPVAFNSTILKNVTGTNIRRWKVLNPLAGVQTSFSDTTTAATTFNTIIDHNVIAPGDTAGLFICLELTDGNGCQDFDTILINVISGPIAVDDTIESCETAFGNATGVFNLNTDGKTAVTAGDTSGVTVSFHLNNTDAVNNTNPLPSPYTTAARDVVARITDTTTGCVAFATLHLQVNGQPDVQNDTLTVCEDIFGASTGTFDLNLSTDKVKKSATGVTVTYHGTLAGAQNESDLLAQPFVSGDSIVFARVENDTTGCFNTASITLVVDTLPFATDDTLRACELVSGGMAANFDLTDADAGISGGNVGVKVTYYEMQAQAMGGNAADTLASPHLDVTTFVYARVEDLTTGCFNLSRLYLMVDTIPDAFKDTLVACETSFGRDTAIFNLTDADMQVSGGAAGLGVTYFTTNADAVNATNPIANPSMYASPDAVIFARVENQNFGCFNISEVSLVVISLPAAMNATLNVCEDGFGSAMGTFNLNSANNTINPGVGVMISYHPSLADAQNNTGALSSPYMTATTTIFARVSDNTTGCVNISTVQLNVNPLPQVSISGSRPNMCIGDAAITLTGSPLTGVFSVAPATAGLVDNGNGTASFNPTVSGAGTFVITYAATNANTGCQFSTTTTINVSQCGAPTISITDPCQCRDNAPGSQGNATTLTNGQFIETVTVNAPTGQVWYIQSVTGLYKSSSPQPPAAPVPFVTGPGGDLFTESSPGVYTLPGIHVDALGYSITVTNGTTTLSTNNTCFYPNPQISGLLAAYCTNEAPVALTGNADPGDLDTFKIYNAATNVLIANNATVFNPGVLGVGNYRVEYILDEEPNVPPPGCQNCNPGCKQAVSQLVEVVNPPGSLACNDLINISLDSDCEVTVHPDAVLEGSYDSYDIFNVVIFDRSRNIGNVVSGAQIGRTLQARVYDRCSGNYCWGNLIVEDKMAPVINCNALTPTNTLSGTIDGADPTFNRPTTFTPGSLPATCIVSAVGTNVNYEVVNFSIPIGGTYMFDMTSTTIPDAFGALYSGGFDPALPCQNLLAADDDSGSSFQGPAIVLMLNLVPGNYTLVTTTFQNGQSGAYQWNVSGPALPASGNLAGIIPVGLDTITVSCTANLDSIPTPIAIDNCEQFVTPQLVGETYVDFSCGRADGTVRIIERSWRAKDRFNNTSPTCKQIIKVVRKSLADVVFPPNYDGMQNPFLDCALPMSAAHPDSTGWPTIDGEPLRTGGNLCMLNVGYVDVILPVCGRSKKILREWTILDWCSPLIPGVNPLKHTQVIKFEDTTPPVYTCPDDFIASTDPDDCTATVLFPPVAATDDCSGVIVQISSPYGVINSNGGLIAGFPIGDHVATYAVSDSCGNRSTCTVTVTVQDLIEPVAVCVEFLTVSLTIAGSATIDATSFDAGSYDNCCLDRFEVKRMGEPDSEFGPTETFTCSDGNDSVLVIVRVYDCEGNYNECMVQVDVQDKLPPNMICPPMKTLGCKDDVFNFAVTGNPIVVDACPLLRVNFSDVDMRDRCGIGKITRTFSATDINSNTRTCTQMITVINDHPFDSTTIVWPKDTTFTNDCGRGLHPDSLAPGYDYPVFPRDSFCADLMVNYKDELFTVVQGACFKIIRTWTIIDWCTYDPNQPRPVGIWKHNQTLKVIDSQGPVLTCPDTLFAYVGANCLAQVTIDTPAVTDCSSDITFVVSGNLTNQFGTVNNVPIGNYTVNIMARDGCNNASTCTFPVIVRDTIAPTPVCKSISTTIGSGGDVIVFAREIDASSSDNCTPVTFSFSPDVADSTRVYTCDSLGFRIVQLWVTDAYGNQDFCTDTVEVQDNLPSNCTGSRPALSGVVKRNDGDPVLNVDVNLSGINGRMLKTDLAGRFSFADLQAGADYTVVPQLDEDHINGVTTFDLTLISKHILRVEVFRSPYQIIAADANNSGTVTTLDLVLLRKLILRVIDELPNNTSWRFVRTDYAFPNPQNPWTPRFPELFSVNNISQSRNDVNFVAIKIGDVNNSAKTNQLNGLDDRSFEGVFNFETTEKALTAGEEATLDFYAADAELISGYQYTLNFDPSAIEVLELVPGDGLDEGNFGLVHLDEGAVTVSWNTAGAVALDSKQPVFSLRVKALNTLTTSANFWIDGSLTAAEAYNKAGEFLQVGLQFKDGNDAAVISHPTFQLFQNEPNPFSQSTVIKFMLPESTEATLSIFDVSGKILKTVRQTFNSGINQIELTKDDFDEKGILYYRLQTSGHSAIKKMILIQ